MSVGLVSVELPSDYQNNGGGGFHSVSVIVGA
jgi:hypothetical protein